MKMQKNVSTTTTTTKRREPILVVVVDVQVDEGKDG